MENYLLKLLCSADWHIDDHQLYSTSISGVPSRLYNYIKLTDEVLKIGESKKVDAFLLAGDFMNKHTNRPRVITVATQCLDNLINNKFGAKLIILDGNHDLDKYSENLNSIILPMVMLQKGKLFYNEPEIKLNGVKIICDPFSKFDRDIDLDPNDKSEKIFVGHGILAGATDSSNYEFETGYSQQFLSKNFNASILGDIHKHGVYKGNILIPGTPIQHSFKDYPETGVWIVTIYKDKLPQFEFVEITNSEFPKFVFVNTREELNKLPDNFYGRVRTHKTVKTGTVKRTVQIKDMNDIIKNMISKVVDNNVDKIPSDISKEKLVNWIESMFDTAVKESTAKKVTAPDVKPKLIHLQNFNSIDDICLDISSNLLILGATGSGKSSILNGLCWCLFGTHPEQKFADDVINDSVGKNCYVKVVLGVEGNEVIVERYRKHSKHNNKVLLNGSEVSDSEVEGKIGIDYKTFLSIYYLNQGKQTFMSTMSVDEQLNFFKFLPLNLEVIDEIIEDLTNKVSNLSFEIRMKERELSGKQVTLNQIGSVVQEKSYEFDENEYSEILISLSTIDEAIEKVIKKKNELDQQLSKLRKDIHATTTEMSIMDTVYKEKSEFIKKAEGFSFEDFCQKCPLYTEIDEASSVVKKLVVDSKKVSEKYFDLEKKSQSVQEKHTTVVDNYSVLMRKRESYSDRFKELESVKKSQAPVKDEIEKIKTELENDQDQIKKLQFDISMLKFVVTYIFNKSIKSLVLVELMKLLEERVHDLIHDFGNIKIRFKATLTQQGKLKGNIETLVRLGKKERPYHKLSGGQKLFTNLAVLIAYGNLTRETTGSISFFLMDEVAQYFDPVFSEYITELLNQSESSIIMTTHVEDFKKIFSQSVTVKLINDVTEIVNQH